MKITIPRVHHETNTFQPVPTPLAAFGRNGTARSEASSAFIAR
nr:M81 family metallopeptidase [Burkholderia sp. BE17]